MKHVIAPLAIAACFLLPLSGAAFAYDLHNFTGMPGQTGSNVFSSCGPTDIPGSLGNGAKLSTATGSPFNPLAVKKYAGNSGNKATNPKAVSQYDNACAQAAIHAMP
jgi:hypothetical protein